jgi:hypothetical protein
VRLVAKTPRMACDGSDIKLISTRRLVMYCMISGVDLAVAEEHFMLERIARTLVRRGSQ